MDMPDNRPRNPQRMAARKRKRRYSAFRLSIVLMFFLVSIVVSFMIYALNFDFSSKPAANTSEGVSQITENVIVTDAEGNTVTDAEGNTVTEKNEVEVKETESSEANSSTPKNPVPESDRQPDSYLEKSVFIGDSISTGLSGYKFVSSENVLASVGLRIDVIGEEKVSNPRFKTPVLVMDAVKSINPENIYILLGSNGVAWYNNDKMLSAYSDFIDQLKTELPDSNVYIISITPVGTMKEKIDTIENGKVLNVEIDSFNQRLLSLANEKDVWYVDVNSELKDENGKLPDDVTSDGMHFNKDTYEKFIDYILTHTAQ